MVGRTHIIGGGLAGLATAVNLAYAGRKVSLYEGSGNCGGRCRSYFEPALGRRIDNGNHLVLSGNHAVIDYLDLIGAREGLSGPESASYPFLDLSSNERWTVNLDAGFLFRAMLSKAGRVPSSSRRDYLKALGFIWAGNDTTVAQCLGPNNVLFKRLWEPLAVAILNTDAHEAAASLLKPVIRETIGKGAKACRPLMAKEGLSETFIDPAVNFLESKNAIINLNNRLRKMTMQEDRVTALEFNVGTIELTKHDSVVLAVPAVSAASLVKGLMVPNESRAIVNGHFKLKNKYEDLSFLGLIGGTAQWLFVRGDVVSVTVSAANPLAEKPAELIAHTLWEEIIRALDLDLYQTGNTLPPYRIVKEKRATFAQTPKQVKNRPSVQTSWSNLFLAGDWIDTGLPATIEGSIRSGCTASKTVLFSSH
jgi:squalene-associated FAD-dependent desaturase